MRFLSAVCFIQNILISEKSFEVKNGILIQEAKIFSGDCTLR